MSKLISLAYKSARKANDIEKLASGKPKRIAKRSANKAMGRKLISKLFWH